MVEPTTMTVEKFLNDTKGFYGQFLQVYLMKDSTTLRYMLHLAHHLYVERSFRVYYMDIVNVLEISKKGGFLAEDFEKVEAILEKADSESYQEMCPKSGYKPLLDPKIDREKWRNA